MFCHAKARKDFFFEKKKPKTFVNGVRHAASTGGPDVSRNG
jgi:hypothetical protein